MVSVCPFVKTGYRAVTLIIAPTPLVAANFILLGRFIRRLGPQYSRLTPKLCKSYNLIQLHGESVMNFEHRYHHLRILRE